VSYCLRASCLAHRRLVFWQCDFKAWVHTNCAPCEALEGEPDPTELHCAYCGVRVLLNTASGSLEEFRDADGHWERDRLTGRLRWVSDAWSRLCWFSPTRLHEYPAVLAAS
jgi:hypothetical protein